MCVLLCCTPALCRFSSGNGAIAMWMIVVVAGFCCGSACVTGNARVLFAFSRDRAVPGHQLWAAVAPWNQVGQKVIQGAEDYFRGRRLFKVNIRGRNYSRVKG